MTILDEISTRFSRRRFAKTAALSLFSAPALASLAACNGDPKPTPPALNPTPTSTPKGQLGPPARPPIIIRGGSMSIRVPTAFSAPIEPGNASLPQYEYKFEAAYPQQAESILVVNDGLDNLSYSGGAETCSAPCVDLTRVVLKDFASWYLKFWVQTVGNSGAYDSPPDLNEKPQFAIKGNNTRTPTTSFFSFANTATGTSPVYVGDTMAGMEYRFEAYNSKPFRLYRVQLSPETGTGFTIDIDRLKYGCHIFLYLAGTAPVMTPTPSATPTPTP